VDDIHTYYVLAGNTPVLVHNTACGDPVEFGTNLGAEISEMPSGRTGALIDRITAAGMSQADAATAAEAAARRAFGGTGGLHTLPDGRVVVLPAKLGPSAPVLVIDESGAVRAGTADFGFGSGDITVTNVQVR
jgi:hypothetical protein